MKHLFALITLTALAAQAAPTPDKGPPKAPIVFAAKVQATDLYDVLTYPARLIPTINATLLSDVEGIVSKVVAALGQPVKKGQKVLVIQNTDPVYQYSPLAITAPVAGIISGVEVSEGSRVMKGQKLATITDSSKVKITIEVSVGDLVAIRPGMPGDLITGGSEQPLPVKVVGVSPFVDPATGSATAELALVGKVAGQNPLPPGAVGKVVFKAREHQGIQIPEQALTYKGPDAFVRVIEKGKAKFQPVQLGQTRRGLVEIVRGLNEGTEVVLRANSFVADGEDVIVQKPEGPKS